MQTVNDLLCELAALVNAKVTADDLSRAGNHEAADEALETAGKRCKRLAPVGRRYLCPAGPLGSCFGVTPVMT